MDGWLQGIFEVEQGNSQAHKKRHSLVGGLEISMTLGILLHSSRRLVLIPGYFEEFPIVIKTDLGNSLIRMCFALTRVTRNDFPHT